MSKKQTGDLYAVLKIVMPPKPDETLPALWQQLADAQSSFEPRKDWESIMANVTVTFTITEFCLHTGISEEELNEIVGLGVVEPRGSEGNNTGI